MNFSSIAAGAQRGTRSRSHWLAVIVAAALAALAWHGPIAQWASYHDFADGRSWLGVPNAANVLSNLPFALIGAWGARRLWPFDTPAQAAPSQRAWWCFALAVACTAFGSAAYHWAPSDTSLVLDRLPIAWACAALSCALLAERVDAAWGRVSVLGGAFAVATASVLAWWLSGDLRAYAAVQFLPMLLVPAALALRLAPTSERTLTAGEWWTVLGLYGLAKLMEAADATVFDAVGLISGHTLKHLLAAGAAWWLIASAINSSSRR